MPDRERTLRTEAIILRRQEIGEADRLLVLLTPAHGKLRALAKGARKPIARKAGHLELYALVDMQLARGREWYYVREAETKEPFLFLREDLTRTAYASHLVELIDRFTGEQDVSRAEFALLRDALGWLCSDADPRTIARYFELHLLALAGFAPALHQCAIGQEELRPQDQYFSPPDGGVICPDHHRDTGRGMPIGLPALKTLRYMQTQPWEAVRVVRIGPTLHLELERLMLAYLTFVLEQRLQSVEFLRRLRHEEA
ncbi:MAG: DNA repair protein RecO [Anaerolineae bacterium]